MWSSVFIDNFYILLSSKEPATLLISENHHFSPVEDKDYRVIKASELPRSERERLQRTLRHDLAESLIMAIRTNPPEIDFLLKGRTHECINEKRD